MEEDKWHVWLIGDGTLQASLHRHRHNKSPSASTRHSLNHFYNNLYSFVLYWRQIGLCNNCRCHGGFGAVHIYYIYPDQVASVTEWFRSTVLVVCSLGGICLLDCHRQAFCIAASMDFNVSYVATYLFIFKSVYIQKKQSFLQLYNMHFENFTLYIYIGSQCFWKKSR